MLRDDGSKNGTFLNGNTIAKDETSILKNGDIITLGNRYVLEVIIEGDEEDIDILPDDVLEIESDDTGNIDFSDTGLGLKDGDLDQDDGEDDFLKTVGVKDNTGEENTADVVDIEADLAELPCNQ